jgi:GT2 family glycosyltransferase
MKRIAILMTVFNRRETTLRCLRQVAEQHYDQNNYSIDIYLTNDGCTDGTPEAIKEKYPLVHIIQGDGNLFWARGMRLAWDMAAKQDYDYYLWLNDDTHLFKNAIDMVLAKAKETDDKAILVGATKDESTNECTYGIIIKGKKIAPNGELQEGYGMNGNFVLISRKIFQLLGNIDSHYHHAGGDIHYGLLARERGVPVYLLGDYIGTCDAHDKSDKWADPNVPFRERWRSLNLPNGMPLGILFYQQRTFYGLPTAIFHTITTIFRCCFPRLWMALKKKT